MSTTFTIPAETHSDDYAVQVAFDARAFFEQATLDQVRALQAIGWGEGMAADAVARYFADTTTAPLFTYLATHPRSASGDTIAFECHVAEVAVELWLRAHRPEWYAQLVETPTCCPDCGAMLLPPDEQDCIDCPDCAFCMYTTDRIRQTPHAD